MRTIEFRGLRMDGKGWAFGMLAYLFDDKSKPHIMSSCDSAQVAFDSSGLAFGSFTPVIAETIGQFTGLYDRNGVKVFEGDAVVTDCVLVFGEPVDGFAGVVKYLECCFYIDSGTDALKVWSDAYQVQVTGNIHEPATGRK